MKPPNFIQNIIPAQASQPKNGHFLWRNHRFANFLKTAQTTFWTEEY